MRLLTALDIEWRYEAALKRRDGKEMTEAEKLATNEMLDLDLDLAERQR